MLSLSCVREVLMRREREQGNVPQTRHRDKPEDTEDEEGRKTQPIVGWGIWKPTRPLYTKFLGSGNHNYPEDNKSETQTDQKISLKISLV